MNTNVFKKILLTGSTGFVGRSFLQNYAGLYQIKTVDLRVTPPEKMDMSGVDTLLHCAALVHQMNGAPAEQYFKINFELTQKLAFAAKKAGVKHFVFLSTAHVYGEYGNLKDYTERLSEKTSCRPSDPYGQSKLQAENFLREIQDDHFQVSVVRSPLVYGPGGKGNLNSLKKLIQFFPVLPFAFPNNRRSLIYVENLAHFLHLIIDQKKAGLFLPQDAAALSIQDIVSHLAAANHKKLFLFRLPGVVFRVLCKLNPKLAQRLFGSLALDSEISNQELGYQPLVSTKEAFRKTFESAR